MSTQRISENKRIIIHFNLVHDYLLSEFNQRNDLQQVKQILDKSKPNNDKLKDKEYNMIYRFKLEKSKGDSLFSTLNNPSGNIGSTLGVRSSIYLDQARRFQMSKQLVSDATVYERNLIRSFTDTVMRNIWRYKSNYLVKGTFGTIFLYNLCKANDNKNLFKLRKQAAPTNVELVSFYYNSAVSFVFALLTFAYI